MMNLKLNNKRVRDKFKADKFVAWHTSQYCAGFPRDLIIKQVLMK